MAHFPLHPLNDRLNTPDPIFSDYHNKFYGTGLPIAIDNGSYQCRAGWANEQYPRMMFRTVVARNKNKKDGEASLLVGNDIKEPEIAKLQPRSPFDQNVVTNFELQEAIFDHVFEHLGIDTSRVEHSIMLTEPTCNPNYCRKNMSELLFEGYNVPSVCYGVDALYSYYFNQDSILNWPHSNGLVISSGHSMTHLYAIVDNVNQPSKCKRLSIGGNTATEFMKKMMHLKYPWHKNYITSVRAQYLKEEHAKMATDYERDLTELTTRAEHGRDIRVVQLPYVIQASDLKKDQERKIQMRKEQGNRLKEINEKKRKEKLQEKEDRLNVLLELKKLQSTDAEEFQDQMMDEGFENETALEEAIVTLEEALGRPPSFTKPNATEEYPLLDIPDSELNEEQLKEKKKQRFLKTTREGRANARKKREETLARQEKEKELEELRFKENPDGYVEDLHRKRKFYIEKREQRQKSKQQVTTGRRAASQQKLKLLTQLDSEEKKGTKRKVEDTFGKSDSDWDVYLSLEDADAQQEQDDIELEHIESLLAKYDPEFTVTNAPPEYADIPPIQYNHQLHLAIERLRVPEMVYQPSSVVGVEQMGLQEIVQSILSTFSEDIQNSMALNIFYTGGNTKFPNFKERLENEVRKMRPFRSTFRVVEARDPILDAWKGMVKFYQDNLANYDSVVLTKQEYDEKGADYFKPFFAANFPY